MDCRVLMYISARRSILETAAWLMPSRLARCCWVNSLASRSSSSAISAIIFLVLASERARDSGDILASSSRKFLAISHSLLFFLNRPQMLGVDLVGTWHKLLIPAIVSGLIAANQQNCHTARIEGEKRAVRPSAMLSSQLLHVRILRGGNQVSMRSSQTRAAFAEEVYAGSDV